MSARHGIWLNLPVKDLRASVEFFRSLGFGFEPARPGEDGACLVIAENARAFLHPESKFRTLTPNAICDTGRYTEVLIGISAPSREKVDEIVRKAVRGGGMIYKEPDDRGSTYAHGFQDLDGHIWEVVATEPATADGR